MPRLVGKRSDTSPTIALLLLLAIGLGVSLEYLGYIDIAPKFGRDIRYTSQEKINQSQ